MGEDLRAALIRVADALDALRADVVARANHDDVLDALPACTRSSGQNLAHYLALRTHDLRPLQRQLQELGLSSLGRSEARVLPTLDRLRTIARAAAGDTAALERGTSLGSVDDGAASLEARAERLFGPRRMGGDARRTRILVTLDGKDADVDRLVARIHAGMDAVRINTAHDDPVVWRALVDAVRAAAARVGRRVPVLFDLPGPKLRTGPLPPGPRVAHVRVERDERGVPSRWTRMRLARRPPRPGSAADVDVVLPFEGDFAGVVPGDVLLISDNRGDRRPLVVEAVDDDGAIVATRRSLWLETGAALRHKRRHDAHRTADRAEGAPRAAAGGKGDGGATDAEHGPVLGCIGPLPVTPTTITLHDGDTLALTAEGVGGSALVDGAGVVEAPAHISLSAPDVLSELRVGDPVLLDDGKIRGRVISVSPTVVLLRIEGGRPGGERLGAEKGVCFPASPLSPRAFGVDDEIALRAALDLGADAVGLSFASSVDDVHALLRALSAAGGDGTGIVLKIETEAGVRALPAMLFAALRHENVGVMIARGDLAVHAGFARLAELQEELLWLAEAAHVPVVWATEVLDRLARRGRPTRAEITDAAMAERAECVMLNKGAYVDDAIAVLADILVRMEAHQQKKTPLLGPLGLARQPA